MRRDASPTVWPCFTQTTVDVIDGLEAAWRFFGGMPKRIVLDNALYSLPTFHSHHPAGLPAHERLVQVELLSRERR